MEKEYIVTVDGKPAGRVVGRERLGEIAPLVAEESEVFVVYDANAAEVAAEVIEAVPGVRGSIAIETSEEDKSMDTVLLIERSLLEAGASRKALVLAVGGEDVGLPPFIKKQCDAVLRIPMKPEAHSYNASVALSLGLYEYARLRIKA